MCKSWCLDTHFILNDSHLTCYYKPDSTPANTIYWVNVSLMLAHRRRRWLLYIKAKLAQHLVFAGTTIALFSA